MATPVFILSLVCIVPISGVTAYLLLVAIGAYFFEKKVEYRGRESRLLVVVPAHNEEGHIRATLERLNQSDYPRSLYSACVIADNCSDRTEDEAREGGARVFRRTDPARRGKGQALDWFFRTYKGVYRNVDAIVMIDADTLVDRRFLKEMAASLKHPEVKVVQGYYGVSNGGAHWRSGLISAAFHVFNHLRPAGINAIGGSAGLRGNGMGFRREVILDTGWPAYSIVEDYEFSLRLLIRGITVHYNPDAMVFSDMPTERSVAETQRMRWEGMDRALRRELTGELFRRFVSEPGRLYANGLIGSFIPPFAAIVSAQSVLFVTGALVYGSSALPLLSWFLVDLFYVVSGLVLRGATRIEWSSLLGAPLYLLWKVPLYIKARRQSSEWVRTKRASEVGDHGSRV